MTAPRRVIRVYVGNGKAVHEAHRGSGANILWTECGWPINTNLPGVRYAHSEPVTCKTCLRCLG